LTFFVNGDTLGSGHVYVNWHDANKYGSEGRQICQNGKLLGPTLSFVGKQEDFREICDQWLADLTALDEEI
jgi:hypothetical protein